MPKLKTNSTEDLSLDQLMMAIDLEERHLKSNQSTLDYNPEDYEAYLVSMCGRSNYVMTEDEWSELNTPRIGGLTNGHR